VLTRQLNEAAKAAQRPATHPTPGQHDEQVRSLESKQVSLGKSLNEEQSTMTKREAEMIRARSEQDEIAAVDVGEDDALDGKA
jgi:kinetochore protein Spc24